MTSSEKAAATRERMNQARAASWEQETEAKKAAINALKRVFDHPDATPEQILQAAGILERLSH